MLTFKVAALYAKVCFAFCKLEAQKTKTRFRLLVKAIVNQSKSCLYHNEPHTHFNLSNNKRFKV